MREECIREGRTLVVAAAAVFLFLLLLKIIEISRGNFDSLRLELWLD
jgi:hypothetical protein